MGKLKIGIFWAGSCGGCDISIIDIHEVLLDVLDKIEFVFWPCATDFKYTDLESMEDGYIDLCLFNGAIRNSENKSVAEILRKKSKILVAFGSCSAFGGIPALSNFYTKEETFERAYIDNPSTSNSDKIMPLEKTNINGYELELPEIYNTVLKLSDVVDVDYIVPGCPPIPDQIVNVLTAVLSGNVPTKGSVLGAGSKNLCEECSRTREEKKIKRFYRPQEIETIDPEKCLLEQGIICMGPATRMGCGAQCPTANLGCRGCYGPTEGVKDQGIKMLSAIASVIDSTDEEEIDKIIDTLPDLSGTFYRFGMSASLLKRRAVKK